MTGLLLALTLVSPNHLVVPTMMSTTTTLTETSPLRTFESLLTLMPAQSVSIPTIPTVPTVPTTAALSVPAPKSVATPAVSTLTFATLPAPWGCIAHYESTDNLTAVNYKSGTEGAFQFMPTTWQEFAPPSFPSSPLQASLGQQLFVAQRVEAARGFGQWETAPLCGE